MGEEARVEAARVEAARVKTRENREEARGIHVAGGKGGGKRESCGSSIEQCLEERRNQGDSRERRQGRGKVRTVSQRY